jgi:hypothetical protein
MAACPQCGSHTDMSVCACCAYEAYNHGDLDSLPPPGDGHSSWLGDSDTDPGAVFALNPSRWRNR